MTDVAVISDYRTKEVIGGTKLLSFPVAGHDIEQT